MKSYYSNGKLLLTGEYLVLDGALSLALPTHFGQHLQIETIEESKLIWMSRDEKENIWFEAEFDLNNNEISSNTIIDCAISNRLIQILHTAQQLNPEFLNTNTGFKVTTNLEFPKNWGLGTSSTLINNISLWANIDAYTLLEKTFGGSGYDIACAQEDSALTYQLIQNKKRTINTIPFDPIFKNQLYFVHLNRKQNSREGIAQYQKQATNLSESISKVNQITKEIITCKTLEHFNSLIDFHEQIISKIINQKPVKALLFKDFNGSIKSLGAWGGDFVLATSKTNPTDYFISKGFETILSFNDMIKNK